jgi:hypothetical protein
MIKRQGRKKRADPEYEVYKAVSDYLKLQYPKVLFHFDYAGVNLSMIQSVKMKRIQKKRGWPDLFIAEPKKDLIGSVIYCGLFIEIKPEGTKITKGGLCFPSTPHIREQFDMASELEDRKYYANIVCGFDQCKIIIDKYLSKKEMI